MRYIFTIAFLFSFSLFYLQVTNVNGPKSQFFKYDDSKSVQTVTLPTFDVNQRLLEDQIKTRSYFL